MLGLLMCQQVALLSLVVHTCMRAGTDDILIICSVLSTLPCLFSLPAMYKAAGFCVHLPSARLQ